MKSPNAKGITGLERRLRWSRIFKRFCWINGERRGIRIFMKRVTNQIREQQRKFRNERKMILSVLSVLEATESNHAILQIQDICFNLKMNHRDFFKHFNAAKRRVKKENTEWYEKAPRKRFPDLNNVSEQQLQSTLKEWEDARKWIENMEWVFEDYINQLENLKVKMQVDTQISYSLMLPLLDTLPDKYKGQSQSSE
ncbi:hypothetical protein Ocin01_07509 [Orchesella cincta]|uniref:Uncharacterized protein n=1 Tax=Orchesella cincta TaxID=48709 RepID=A0A1D2N1S6_ORCCI|nr:hypothetical protein Ocin01_07509 [Orchesella cincta]